MTPSATAAAALRATLLSAVSIARRGEAGRYSLSDLQVKRACSSRWGRPDLTKLPVSGCIPQMHTQEMLEAALCAALELRASDLAAVDDLVRLAVERQCALVTIAVSDARGTIEWQRQRVKQAADLLAEIGTAPIAPGAADVSSADGELMTEAEVVELLRYPIRWVRHNRRFTRSGKGRDAMYQRAEIRAYKQERDASGWLTLEEAEERLAFPHLRPFECARALPSVKVRGQLRFARLEVERERPARAAHSRAEEALGADGRRARDERIRREVQEQIAKWRRDGTLPPAKPTQRRTR